jgi:heme/copper-type cytochrome/quinol oxidase subunit 2
VKIYRDRTRGRARQAPLWLVQVALWGLQIVLAAQAVRDEGGAWDITWLASACAFLLVSVVFLVRARRIDRAANDADPPLE